jgi:hypothetical protein
MVNWRKHIKIKNLFTENEDHQSIQDSMNKIADVLREHYEFKHLIKRFRSIPKGDDIFKSVDYANKLLNEVYNIADNENIWIE